MGFSIILGGGGLICFFYNRICFSMAGLVVVGYLAHRDEFLFVPGGGNPVVIDIIHKCYKLPLIGKCKVVSMSA